MTEDRSSHAKAYFKQPKLWTKTHTGEAIVAAAQLDLELQNSILTKMRPLSKKKQKRLRLGFAAKIELAYALGLIDDKFYCELRAIKEIRNAFAHAPKQMTFGSKGGWKILSKAPQGQKDHRPKPILRTSRRMSCAHQRALCRAKTIAL